MQQKSSVLLLACTAIALIVANSPWASSYVAFWHTEIGPTIGVFDLSKSVVDWINDGLMAVFFFVVGLEVKREVLRGELSTSRKAALPIAAALGGMLVPAFVYSLINDGGEGAPGWGIPMATDIAFALGILGLLGKRIPLGLTVFLTALAIADDIGAVVVIAVFYNAAIAWMPIVTALALIALLILANNRRPLPAVAYIISGILVWFCMLQSGVHASMAGVLIALTIPAHVDSKRRHPSSSETPLLDRFEHGLAPWVAFFIMPVFALANAGIALSGSAVTDSANPSTMTGIVNSVTYGVFFGLVIGKPIGILLCTWLAVRLGFARLPSAVSWQHIHGAAWLGGIGFTMAIFIATLAFTSDALETSAKVGVLTASLVAGIVGWTLLRSSTRSHTSSV